MDVAVGSPLDVTYRFAVAPDAPAFSEDYTVFVHVLDKDRSSMWGDDHLPPTPTTQWKPGSTVEYTRTMFVPKLPYVGPAQIEVGLYSIRSGQRVPLSGENTGDRSIRVATFNMQLPANALFIVFRDGWHDAEVSGEAGVEWQWSKKQGTLSFRNPKQDANFMIELDEPVQAFAEPQKVEIRVGDAVVDSFSLPTGRRELRRISLTAAPTRGRGDRGHGRCGGQDLRPGERASTEELGPSRARCSGIPRVRRAETIGLEV
jgi:hypothetical protein